jgi:queuine tRNA-ribosyltransferase
MKWEFFVIDIQKHTYAIFAANEYLENKLRRYIILGFICGWFCEARKHILAGDFKPWKEMMVKNMSQRL